MHEPKHAFGIILAVQNGTVLLAVQFGATFAKLKGLESAGQRGIIIFVPSLRLSERTLLGFLLSLDKKSKLAFFELYTCDRSNQCEICDI